MNRRRHRGPSQFLERIRVLQQRELLAPIQRTGADVKCTLDSKRTRRGSCGRRPDAGRSAHNNMHVGIDDGIGETRKRPRTARILRGRDEFPWRH